MGHTGPEGPHPHDTHTLEWELSPSLPQGTVGGAFELREVTFFLFPLGIFFFYVNKRGFQGPCVQRGLGQYWRGFWALDLVLLFLEPQFSHL